MSSYKLSRRLSEQTRQELEKVAVSQDKSMSEIARVMIAGALTNSTFISLLSETEQNILSELNEIKDTMLTLAANVGNLSGFSGDNVPDVLNVQAPEDALVQKVQAKVSTLVQKVQAPENPPVQNVQAVNNYAQNIISDIVKAKGDFEGMHDPIPDYDCDYKIFPWLSFLSYRVWCLYHKCTIDTQFMSRLQKRLEDEGRDGFTGKLREKNAEDK